MPAKPCNLDPLQWFDQLFSQSVNYLPPAMPFSHVFIEWVSVCIWCECSLNQGWALGLNGLSVSIEERILDWLLEVLCDSLEHMNWKHLLDNPRDIQSPSPSSNNRAWMVYWTGLQGTGWGAQGHIFHIIVAQHSEDTVTFEFKSGLQSSSA